MSTDWTNDPEAADKALQESLEDQLKKYPDRFLKESKSGGTVSFNGDKSPFYAIQAYVWSGMLYPDNNSDFEQKLPSSRFEPLEGVLPKIYEDTENALVAVSKSCHTFSSGPMEPVFSYSSLVKIYATNAKISLGADDGLGAQLRTLQDDKYKGKEKTDDDFQAAKLLAKERLGELNKEAEEKEKQSETLRKQLVDFSNEITANKIQIEAVDKKYQSPLTVSGKEYPSALDYLSKELSELQKKLKDAEDNAKKVTDDLKEQVDPKGWSFWCNILGGAASSWNILQKVQEFKNAFEKLRDQSEKLADVQTCSTTVTALKSQIDELVTRMKAAITGIETVRDNFRHLGESLDPLIKAIDKIESGTSAALLAIRKSNISHGIKDALAKYDEIIKQAEDFAKAAQIKVSDQ